MRTNQQIVTSRKLSASTRAALDALGFTGGSLKADVAYFQATHLDDHGKPLAVTGAPNEGTSWALTNSTGKKQKSGLEGKIPKVITGQRRELLELALGEHAKGVKERPNGSNRSKEIDKYFPGWQLRKLGKKGKGPAWCAFFVNWLFSQILGKRPWGGYIGSCVRLVKAAQKSDQCRVFSNPALAAPGDIFVIIHGTTGHTGVLLRKNTMSTKINTTEGNCGNRVKVGLRETKDIAWYISVFPELPEAQRSSPLLKVKSTGRSGTR